MCTLREQTRQRQPTTKLRLFLSDVPEAGAFLALHGLLQTPLSGNLENNGRTLVKDQVPSVYRSFFLFNATSTETGEHHL